MKRCPKNENPLKSGKPRSKKGLRLAVFSFLKKLSGLREKIIPYTFLKTVRGRCREKRRWLF